MFGCGVLYYSLEIDKAENKIIKKLDLKNVDLSDIPLTQNN